MTKLTQKQLDLLKALAANPGKCRYHRPIGSLSPAATISIDGETWTRIDATVTALEQLGFIGVNRREYTSPSYPIYSLPSGREHLASLTPYTERNLRIVNNDTASYSGGFTIEHGPKDTAIILAGPYAAKSDAVKAKKDMILGLPVKFG